MEDLSNLIFDVKEKLTDSEFKTIMEKMGELRSTVRLPFELSYIKIKVNQDDEDELQVEPTISKGYAMISQTDEESIRNDIETDGAAKRNYQLFSKLMGYKINWCLDCIPFMSSQVHLNALDQEIEINYNTYFVIIVRISQLD